MIKRLFKKRAEREALPFSAYGGSEPYTFVSYAHLDSAIVYPILSALHERGVLMWYDEGINPGSEWPKAIAERIVSCSKMMLFVSPSAVRSQHVRQEINFANSKNKPILPIFLEDTILDPGLEMTLSVFQSLHSYNYPDIESFCNQAIRSLEMGFAGENAEETMFIDNSASDVILRIDAGGDKNLPALIRLRNAEKFSIGRFDVSLNVRQSDFEFDKSTKNISRRHAVFERTSDGYTITDLNSKAGTWVNGHKITPNTRHPLKSGMHISFGNAGADYILDIPELIHEASGREEG